MWGEVHRPSLIYKAYPVGCDKDEGIYWLLNLQIGWERKVWNICSTGGILHMIKDLGEGQCGLQKGTDGNSNLRKC